LNYLKFNDQEYNCAFARDISDRKQSEAALRKSEEQYRTLAKNFPNGAVLLFDRDLRYLIAEGGELATAGLSKELVEGKRLWDTFAPEICEVFEPAYRAALAGETRIFEFCFAIKSTSSIPCQRNQRRWRNFCGYGDDSKYHRAQASRKELQRSNALLKAQQEAALDGILVIDEKGAIASYNRRFCEMWQIPEQVMHSRR
jgi:PAS domain-containing protein